MRRSSSLRFASFNILQIYSVVPGSSNEPRTRGIILVIIFFFFPLVFRTSTARRGQRDVRRDPEIARTERQPETDTSRDNYASGELGARIAGTGSRKLHCFLLYLPVHRSAIRDFSPLISLLFVFFSLSLLRLVVFHFASLVIETERRSDLGIFFLFRLKILGFPGVRDFNTSYFQRTRHGTCL